ncbi:MAG: putative porin [Endomicrobium sp.]|nr:putative porin [Endomicrobium sp.]
MIKKILILIALVFAGTTFLQASQIDDLANKLSEKGIISQEEAETLINAANAADKSAEKKTVKESSVTKWVSNMKISGDITLRSELTHDEKGAQKFDRERQRARFRLGFETAPSEKTKAVFGLETSGTNPTSAFVDFEDFSNAAVFLAYAYFQYAPSKTLSISAGKIKSGLSDWKPSQLIWKTDVNPYGLAVNANIKKSDKLKFFANAGWYSLTRYQDNETARDIPMNISAILQGGAEYKQGNFSAKAAIAFRQFDFQGHSTTTWIKSNGSLTLINPSWEIKYNNIVSSYGVVFSGEYSSNVNDAAKEDKNAFIAYLGIGDDKVNDFGKWQLKGGYRRVEANAIPLGFGNTSAYNADPGKGFEGFAALGLLKNLTLNITYYDMTNIDGKKPQQVTQIDVVYKF